MLASSEDLWIGTSGPRNADIAIVGESWGYEESVYKQPFVGQAGKELDRMLLEAGLQRGAIFCTNVFNVQPKGNDAWRLFEANSKGRPTFRGLHTNDFVNKEWLRLVSQLQMVRPKLVIATGNYPLWSLTSSASISSISTGEGATVLVPGGILSWRGSQLLSDVPALEGVKVLPIVHPASILRQWYQRAMTVHDLRVRVPKAFSPGQWIPDPRPTIWAPPTFEQVTWKLSSWLERAEKGPLRLAHDIETIPKRGIISCEALGEGPFDSTGFALVIPWIILKGGELESFWTESQEFIILRLLNRLLTHPNIRIEGQNYLYDIQWKQIVHGCSPRLDFDTMLAHHLLFPGTPKDLGYLSSLYCAYHRYWKDDNKEWDTKGNFFEHLLYNGEDALRTFESATALRQLIRDEGFSELWEWEKKKNALALQMMNKGVRIDTHHRAKLAGELFDEAAKLTAWLEKIIPQWWLEGLLKTSKSKWWSSPKQQQIVFHDILGLPRQFSRKTKRATLDFEALEELKRKNPDFSRIFDALIDLRSINVFHSTFIQAPLDPDKRMRCMIKTAGTETFRWATSENAFGRGTNLQNIPKGEEKD